MKAYSKILIGFLVQGLVIQTAFGQTKKTSDSVFVNAQIKPKFSEMVDYGLPTNKEGVHEFPGGKAPVSNQINSDGSIRINKTGRITVPAEIIRTTEIQKATDRNTDSDSKIKSKKRKN
ncbi:hypothetical protein [Dyadobacter frigoris]|uniref:Uncharacterized protein n=1 Tax=Dyadobacter frigoris TaxID=2576211 RepID=A0A4U6CYZ6_9BACT|nr:hypothetical protein [Dyadobacter frigoris]TKT86654.1 hypothetical protein FDK13_31910 [Dyadobacter frigoris]GLU56797.1 hypothetical protein Dfri01_62580 [Dyadobacter frigoris]